MHSENQKKDNRCCEENSCSNGGTCTERCNHAKQKFNCTCAIGYVGKFCKKKSPTSCKQLQLEAKKRKNSTVYTLYDPAGKSFYQTFCDLTSENGFVWTLLESFSLANNNHFQAQPFYKDYPPTTTTSRINRSSRDYPVSQNSFKWNKFRLSWSIMNSTLSHSTHFRATCNFNTDGLVFTDYLTAKTAPLNILQLKLNPCVKMEYINIRGYDCYNCWVWMTQGINWHLHTDLYYGANYCQVKSARRGMASFHK
ncbi:uncharacterized protein [Acropora muricata]|uniref:uncharacterized protein n=1 Tax=Acropora muricata TaxID=159855 RepID=UPI0034E4EF38